ncbi:hypothetical protein FSP39_005409 [Pinctada imbricata]|uniref:G-protein coupled receptors family 1 profile domain-containing protein n=1 Tax=Pinctada imbricata TaxID=66713 RepID=A0AA88XTV6_PINIB|nr:hypothetical protein FSP39_005409 [Pinctada imbricata]
MAGISVTVAFMNSTNDSVDEDYNRRIIEQLNYEKTQRLLPVLIYLILLMSLGIVGNAIVLYVYKFRFKRSSSRAFILCLAILDFITCIFGIPYHLYDIYNPLTYYNVVSCKILSYSMSITLLSSTFVLALISIDRYQKICRPFGKQLSDFGTKKACIAACIVALLIAIPNLIMYGNSTIELDNSNLTGTECFINDDYAGTTESLIYLGMLFLIFNSTTVVLSVLYILIGCKIWKPGSNMAADDRSSKGIFRKGSFRLCGSEPDTTNEILSETDDSKSNTRVKAITFHKDDQNGNQCKMEFESSCDSPIVRNSSLDRSVSRQSSVRGDSKDKHRKSQHHKGQNRQSFFKKRLRHAMSVDDEETSGLRGDGNKNVGKTVSLMSNASLSKRQKRTLRITGMLFMVTLVFVVSFLPHLVILMLEAVKPELFQNMSDRGELIYNFLLRTYFINTMANPIVYTFLDPKFRYETIHLFLCIVKCKSKQIPKH